MQVHCSHPQVSARIRHSLTVGFVYKGTERLAVARAAVEELSKPTPPLTGEYTNEGG